MELVVSAGPHVAMALTPVLTAFGRLSGLGGRRARALAQGVVALVCASCRRSESVRVRLQPRARRLRILIRLSGGALLLPRRPFHALTGVSVERQGRGSLVFLVPGPFRGR
jgi:hypothetical protein